MMSNRLTVKNTFLNFDVIDSHKNIGVFGRARSLSDSGLDTLHTRTTTTLEAELDAKILLRRLDIDSTIGDEDDGDDGTIGGSIMAHEGMCASGSQSSGYCTPPLEDQFFFLEASRNVVAKGVGDDMSLLQQEVERLAMESRRLEDPSLLLHATYNASSLTFPLASLGGEAGYGSSSLVHGDAGEIDGMQHYMYIPVALLPQEHLLQPQVQLVSTQGQPLEHLDKKDSELVTESHARTASEFAPEAERTTVMLRNLPNNYSISTLLEMIDSEGFAGKYDFVYLPMDFTRLACLGYAFVNLCDSVDARRFWAAFDGYSRWRIPSRKICYVSWSDPQQGLQANIDRYKNSPVMHETVPEEYKPRIYKDGVQLPFPQATRKLRAPRMRR